MATDICTTDISILQKKAQRDALGIEILLSELARPFVRNVYAVLAYYYALKMERFLKKYVKTYDLNSCAKCHGFEKCSKAFYATDKRLLENSYKYFPKFKENVKAIKMSWLINKSINILQDCQEKIEDRVEDMELILETKDGILDEIANALDKAEPKLTNWRQALPFLQ